MARLLVEDGHDVRGYDTSDAARERFEQSVASIGAAADSAEVVILMLPSSAVVEQVLLGDGLLDAVPANTLVVDMGSSEPTSTRRLAETAAARNLQLIDAPVSGGVRKAVDGTLTIMAGGPPEHFERARPLLEVLGGSVLHVGPVGAGHALKALNNLLSATTLLASTEAMVVGREFGLDPQTMLDVINGSTGRSWSTEFKLPEYVLTGRYDSAFGLGLMVKDLGIAVGLADATGSPLRLGRLTAEIWAEAGDALPDDADHTELSRWLGA
jgi:3-hydroxyisobutyrate dehydrogenase